MAVKQISFFINNKQTTHPFIVLSDASETREFLGEMGGGREKVCEFMDEPTRNSMIKM